MKNHPQNRREQSNNENYKIQEVSIIIIIIIIINSYGNTILRLKDKE